MRILPYELYKYAPDVSLCALRKEFGMYDYCLNKNLRNKGMQPFLDLDRNYFNLSINKWVNEMTKRKHYVNTFHFFYAKNNKYLKIKTNFFLILECCIQWNIKNFIPYKSNLSWFEITMKIFKRIKNPILKKFNLESYNKLLDWYQHNFMKLNKTNKLKTNQLNMIKVIFFF
ncbi:hypothetical protein J8J04_02560 ['Fragaria x ananassa' phyllody phytoplasma]|uniref:Uncharacterized protein n=1 Tax='Fragaria x ananassa' phyllody phytoplasma TaxID=2358428 RepID=A0ABS5K3S2_9MOLU|nr:hypothetical protein ['Fragaria x ananassa' phyllody phytoplasma]MBS2126557.1 hypothetical protein ['Fragaria x ananassa' phyllody phytoplasma]